MKKGVYQVNGKLYVSIPRKKMTINEQILMLQYGEENVIWDKPPKRKEPERELTPEEIAAELERQREAEYYDQMDREIEMLDRGVYMHEHPKKFRDNEEVINKRSKQWLKLFKKYKVEGVDTSTPGEKQVHKILKKHNIPKQMWGRFDKYIDLLNLVNKSKKKKVYDPFTGKKIKISDNINEPYVRRLAHATSRGKSIAVLKSMTNALVEGMTSSLEESLMSPIDAFNPKGTQAKAFQKWKDKMDCNMKGSKAKIRNLIL